MRALLAGLVIVATGVAAIVVTHANPRSQIVGGILLDVGIAALLLGGLLWRWQRQLDHVDRVLSRIVEPPVAGEALQGSAPRSARGADRQRVAG